MHGANNKQVTHFAKEELIPQGRAIISSMAFEEAQMDYRLYVLDEAGRVRSRIDLECASDEDACQRARAAAQSQRVELWQGQRRIGTFEAPVLARPA